MVRRVEVEEVGEDLHLRPHAEREARRDDCDEQGHRQFMAEQEEQICFDGLP
jgi:virulence-associated protein VagC